MHLWGRDAKIAAMGCTRRQKQTIQSVFLYVKTTCSIKKRIQQVVFLYHSAVSSKGFCWFRQGAFFAIVLTNKPLLPIIRKETPFYANGRKPNVITARRGLSPHSGQNLFIEIKWLPSEAGKVVSMAEIAPLRALRYTAKAGSLENLVCPPYDVLAPGDRETYLARSPYNSMHLEVPDSYPQAADLLNAWTEQGILKRDSAPAMFIYEQEFSVRGETLRNKLLLCRMRLSDFSENAVLPHENTLDAAKRDRFQLMQATGCNISPVYGLYEDPKRETRERIERLSMDTPRYTCTLDGVTHRLWVVNDRVVLGALCEDFRDRRIYIADGHHRYETALHFRNWRREQGLPGGEFILTGLADLHSAGLAVLPIHRLVHGLEHFDEAALLKQCEAYFQVYEMDTPPEYIETNMDALHRQAKKAFAYYSGGKTWHLLLLKDETLMDRLCPEQSPATRNLNVSLLHKVILEGMLGIGAESLAKQENLTYTRHFSEALASARSGESQCVFFVNPARVKEIREVADAGETLPQKSTWFYPKLLTGLAFHPLDE